MTTADTSDESSPGAVTSRIERKRDRKVASILQAAAEVLSERGYHNLNLDEIAERLDLTKASLYHYFPSKEALVSACVESLASSANRRLAEAAVDVSGSAAERLSRLILVQLTIILREQPQLAALFLQPLDWPERYRQRTRALRLEHDAIFRTVVRDGIASGEFDTDEQIAMHNLYGAMNFTPVWLQGLTKREFDTAAQAVATNLLRLFVTSTRTTSPAATAQPTPRSRPTQ
jgi:AcrR family transcriptional regulator